LSKHSKRQFFTVPFDLLLIKKDIPYDLYINSSSSDSRDHFVRVFPKGDFLERIDVINLKRKYFQVYLLESQRGDYLKSLSLREGVSDEKKTNVIKETAINYLDKLFNPEKEFTTDVLKSSIKGCQDSVEGMVSILKDYDITEVQDLIGKMSFHDFYTYDHSINVAMYAISLCKAYNPKASQTELMEAGLGGLLHDLGKIKIPTSIINNSGKLSEEDFNEIKNHPRFGIELLVNFNIEFKEGVRFNVVKRVIHEHHENFNGTGYPNKLKEEEIHLYARMTAICDFFDAITTKRSYHEVLSTEDAIAVMARTCGKKIDEEVFKVFVKNISNLVYKGKTNQEIDFDFDPCMPHEKLPISKAGAEIQLKDFFKKDKELGFGKIIDKDKGEEI